MQATSRSSAAHPPLGIPRRFMKRSHAPLLRHDLHPIGGNELETVIADTGGMLPCIYLNETAARSRNMQTVCRALPSSTAQREGGRE